jgi:Flp pilus assembly protein TadG
MGNNQLGILRHIENERGSSLIFFAAMLMVLFGFFALAVDVGMMLTTRSEAQRAADAAALAGASAYLDYSIDSAPTQARDNAWSRAIDYAALNSVGGRALSTGATDEPDGNYFRTENVTVQADLPNDIVRVWVEPGGYSTFFAGLLGIDDITVSAVSAAHVSESGTSPCVVPMYLPDAPDLSDPFTYDPQTTGYGSPHRDAYWAPDPPLAGDAEGGTPRNYIGDFGRRIPLWPGSGSSGSTDMGWVLGPHASNYGFFKAEEDGSNGMNIIQDAFRNRECIDVSVGDTVWAVPGARTALITPGGALPELWNADPYNTRWDHNAPGGPGVVSTDPDGNWRASSRIFTVALVDPRSPPAGPNQPAVITNFATVIMEPLPWPPKNGMYVSVRVLPVNGSPDGCGGAECSTNVKRLQLIQ